MKVSASIKNVFYKNFYFFDYTLNTEFFIFTDTSLLTKNITNDDFSLIPSFKTYIYSNQSALDDSLYFFKNLPFSENQYWNEKNDLNAFLYLKTSSFISFFINSNVDIPTCFKKSKSLAFKNFELPFIRFFNFIMRQGKRDKIIRVFFKKILNRSNLWENYQKVQFTESNQKMLSTSIYLRNYRNLEKFDTFVKIKKHLPLFFLLSNFEKNYVKKIYSFPFFYRNKNFEIRSSFFFKNSFLKLFNTINPVFIYFIYNVDKNIRKYSRGKSGKYAFVWKYISPYKRLFLAMRLFAKELKFRGERKFFERFLSSLSVLENDFKNSFIYQSKAFSHNYVFKNFKKTLLVSLKTISK